MSGTQVALIEKAYELIANLIEMGPAGIFEMIKEQLNPQAILDQVLEAAVDFLIEALIKAVSIRVIALFNPVGAIVQAIEAIYKVLKWIFENAARIFSLVETVVNGIADIIAGNVSGMATAVEQALARLIAPVVDFLAGFLGIGDLPDKIADTIKGFQTWIEGILDRVIGWLAERAKALLRSLGIGEESQDEVEEDNPEKADQVRAGLATIETEEQHFVENGEISHQEAVQVANNVKQTHPVFKRLEVVDGEDSWDYYWEASPGNTKVTLAKKEEDASGSTIPDTTITIPFNMMGEAHTLKGVASGGSVEIAMASREAIISNGLFGAISELRGMSNFPGRSQIIRRLERAQELSDRNNLVSEWRTLTKEQSSQLPQGVNTFDTFLQHRLSEIISEINDLTVGNKPITALTEMFRQLNRNNGPYSYMTDPLDVAPYKDFSSTQRQELLRENMSKNGGKIIADDGSGLELDDSLPATDPLKPNIDHIFPKVLGGSNSYSNAMVIARDANSAKRARVTIAPGFGLPPPASPQSAPRPTVIRRRKP